MSDKDLIKCFDPPPLPERKEGQTYQPVDRSWYELQFRYKIEIKATGASSTIKLDKFFQVKHDLQSDPARWGIYREDWFAHVTGGYNIFYFMDRDRAIEFRLWVTL